MAAIDSSLQNYSLCPSGTPARCKFSLQPVVRGVVKELSGTITGKVTDSTGAPVEGAVVTATSGAGTGSSITLAEGSFKNWALLPGSYTLTVTDASGVARAVTSGTSSNLTVVAGGNTNAGVLVVQ